VKFELAQEIVARFHSDAAAQQAQQDFTARFQQGAVPEDLAERVVEVSAPSARLVGILKELGFVASASEASRKIQEGAVRVNQEKIASHSHELQCGSTYIVSVGKRSIAKIRLTQSG
jgi:tyrosyl-tRNA synthetase